MVPGQLSRAPRRVGVVGCLVCAAAGRGPGEDAEPGLVEVPGLFRPVVLAADRGVFAITTQVTMAENRPT